MRPAYHTRRIRKFGDAYDCLAVVAIPARDEERLIAACLSAVAVGAPERIAFVVFCNNCSDSTFEAAESAIRSIGVPATIVDGHLEEAEANAGAARKAAMDLARDRLGSGGAILTTDADSRPMRGWVHANLKALARGVDGVAGRVLLDPLDAAGYSPMLRARGRLEDAYEALLTELFAWLDPEAHDPWPRHASEPGASLAVTALAYEAIGGVPCIPCGEDRALFQKLRTHGFRVRHDPEISVTTSGRLIGRAQGGVAETIRRRNSEPDAPCDPYLEPAYAAWRRGLVRSRLRDIHSTLGFLDSASLRELGIPTSMVEELAEDRYSFELAWEIVERASPSLRRTGLIPRAIPLQITIAQYLLSRLRNPQPAEYPFDSPVSAAAE